MITSGLLFPVGRADRVPGGYWLGGRWQFASGINHCDWVASGAVIYTDGQPEPGVVDGSLNRRIMMVPRDQMEVIDTWRTTGLAGSGSCDYTITDVFVPEEHTFRLDVVRSGAGPLAQPEAFMRNMPGVARAALDHVRELARTGRHPVTGAAWADDWRTQVTLAGCEADFVSSRYAVYGTMQRHWDLLSDGRRVADLTADDRAAPALARLHAFRTARAPSSAACMTRPTSRSASASSASATLFLLADLGRTYSPIALKRWAAGGGPPPAPACCIPCTRRNRVQARLNTHSTPCLRGPMAGVRVRGGRYDRPARPSAGAGAHPAGPNRHNPRAEPIDGHRCR